MTEKHQTTDGSPAPRTPEEWFDAAQRIYRDVLVTLGRYGVEPDPVLRLVPGEGLAPYYEPATRTIGIGMPDPDTPGGRLCWIFAARLLMVNSVEEAMAAMAQELPMLAAHEITHHLRHHYGAPIENDFIEEQIANTVAVAFLREHPAYRRTLSHLKARAERASKRLSDLSPDTVSYLPGFRPDLGEALVAGGRLGREQLEDLRELAEALEEPLDELLDEADVVADAELDVTRDLRRETESYFNRAYMKNFYEYAFFHNEWLRAYLEREDFPTLGEALEAHILTGDWEQSRRQETILLLEATLRHADEELAAPPSRRWSARREQRRYRLCSRRWTRNGLPRGRQSCGL